MHRKPSMIRKALRRLAALLPALAVTAGAVLATAGTASAATYHDHAAADAKFCAYFPEFGSSLVRTVLTDPQWRRVLPGTDRELWQTGTALDQAIRSARSLRVAQRDYWRVYRNCNPDAGPKR